ncbi:HNH endonuclease [Methylobacterium durans]|uniref:Fis family transcriptional regulator n=1 Tax=Methylobacterium durans TaxID=2202825 RepID=A0A2U8WCZ4_9HYPH|nr:HNH endonuclease [Methylobacterium durans]AWN43142.1 Fis family transcriptional regulator [Methylobacterium durans]
MARHFLVSKGLDDLSWLRAHLAYDGTTGIVRWIKAPAPHLQYLVGTPAGCRRPDDNYLRIVIGQRKIGAHIVAWALHHGELPDGIVDHRDCDTFNNKLCNLRLADERGNAANRQIAKNNTSGFKGVSWSKQRRKFKAYIKTNDRQIHLGLFDTAEAASAAYTAAADRIFGAFARAA